MVTGTLFPFSWQRDRQSHSYEERKQRACHYICHYIYGSAEDRSDISKKAHLTDLFRTLLHQLMTAQIRVHDLALPELPSSIAEDAQ